MTDIPPQAATEQKPSLFELRVSAMYGAGMFANGLMVPFLPVWLNHLGLGASEIATIIAAPGIVRVLTAPPLIAAADRSADRIRYLVNLSVATLACVILLAMVESFWPVLAVFLVFAFFSSPYISITDAVALSGVRRFGSDYARMRVWGSITFLVANLIGGYALGWFGAGVFPSILIAMYGAALVFAITAPRLGRARTARPGLVSMVGDAGKLLSQRYFTLFIVSIGLVSGSHAMFYAFSSLYWRSLGIPEADIGLLWAIGVLAEILMFYAFRRYFSGYGAAAMLIAGTVLTIIRWIGFPIVGQTGLGFAGFAVLQTLHAFSYGLTFLAMQKMIAERVAEDDTGTAQAFYFLVHTLLLSVFTFFCGPLYERMGGNGFHVMAAIAVAGILVALPLLRDQPQSAASGGDTSEPA